MAGKFYAIKEGFDSSNNVKVENKIVTTWDECLKYVKGVKGAVYKSFKSIDEAKSFINNTNQTVSKASATYPDDCMHIYVDGSYNISTNKYAYAFVVVLNDVVIHIENGSAKSDDKNNIRQIAGELEASIRGLEFALSQGAEKVVIFHDYLGIAHHATGFWSRREESSIKYYNKMQEMMKKGIDVIFVKVDSHTGDLYNELADEKCKEILGISSDNVVRKHLKNNTIKVKNEEVKNSISELAPEYKENIIM